MSNLVSKTRFVSSLPGKLQVHQYNACVTLDVGDMAKLRELIDKKLCETYLQYAGRSVTESEIKFVPWPEDWPWYKQDCFGSWSRRCDMLIGPCCCGSWHEEGEFVIHQGLLYRYGKKVNFMVPEGRKDIPYESGDISFIALRP